MDGQTSREIATRILGDLAARLGPEYHIGTDSVVIEVGNILSFEVFHRPSLTSIPLKFSLSFLNSLSFLSIKKIMEDVASMIETKVRFQSQSPSIMGYSPSPWANATQPDPRAYGTPPSSFSTSRDFQDFNNRLHHLQTLLQNRFGGEVFFTRSPIDGMVIYVELKGSIRSIKSAITTTEVVNYPFAVLVDIVAGRFYTEMISVQQTQELDPHEELSGPDWAEDVRPTTGINVHVGKWTTLREITDKAQQQLMEQAKKILSDAAISSILTGIGDGIDFGSSTQNAISLASQKKPPSKNENKSKGRKKK